MLLKNFFLNFLKLSKFSKIVQWVETSFLRKRKNLVWSLPEILQKIDIAHRVEAHLEFQRLLRLEASDAELAQFALGDVLRSSNYCAQIDRESEQVSAGTNLAAEIKENNPDWEKQVANLVRELSRIPTSSSMAEVIIGILKRYHIDYLKISVASEMAMVLNPHLYTVINRRTLFAYFKMQQMQQRQQIQQTPTTKSDQELIKKLSFDYDSWEKYAGPTWTSLEQFYRQQLAPLFPYPQYQFFYTEGFWSIIYDQVKHEQNAEIFEWPPMIQQFSQLRLPPLPILGMGSSQNLKT